MNLEDIDCCTRSGTEEKYSRTSDGIRVIYQKVAYFDYTAAPDGNSAAHAPAGQPFSFLLALLARPHSRGMAGDVESHKNSAGSRRRTIVHHRNRCPNGVAEDHQRLSLGLEVYQYLAA